MSASSTSEPRPGSAGYFLHWHPLPFALAVSLHYTSRSRDAPRGCALDCGWCVEPREERTPPRGPRTKGRLSSVTRTLWTSFLSFPGPHDDAIAALNDEFRRSGSGGSIYLTRGVVALGTERAAAGHALPAAGAERSGKPSSISSHSILTISPVRSCLRRCTCAATKRPNRASAMRWPR